MNDFWRRRWLAWCVMMLATGLDCTGLDCTGLYGTGAAWADSPGKLNDPAEQAPETIPPAEQPPAQEPAADHGKLWPWIAGLEEGVEAAQELGRPVLVRFEGEFCPWCKRLNAEIARPSVQAALGRWTLVVVSIEKFPEDARRLAVGPIPALRVLTQRGTLVASHDGYMPADELIAWLDANYVPAATLPDDALTGEGEPSLTDVVRLARLLGTRDQTLREAAMRRLLPYPAASAAAVVDAFEKGRLAARLSALELLLAWHAPLAGLDPWQPQTVTPEGLARLAAWSRSVSDPKAEASKPAAFSVADRQTALADLDRLATASDADAAKISERLARFAAQLLPEVRSRAAAAETDELRQRLTALRYRLTASDSLAINWPGGLNRVASRNPEVRHAAMNELLARATSRDEPLLLELFTDNDPLIRELSLRGLQSVSGNAASSALVKLLDDPDPNVQAAVLKQLAETPSAAFIKPITTYLEKPHDQDLLVHAVRALSETKSSRAVKPLVALTKHDSWQVRAEAIEALSKLISGHSNVSVNNDTKAEGYAAMVERISDADPFVISRALEGLTTADMELADVAEPVIELVDKHPELAARAVAFAVANLGRRARVSKQLKRLLTDNNPEVRAAVVGSLSEEIASSGSSRLGDPNEVLRRALEDHSETARISAAKEVFELQQKARTEAFARFASSASASGGIVVHDTYVKPAPGLLGSLSRLLLGSGAKTKSAKKADSKPTTEPEKVEQNEKQEKGDKQEKKTEKAESKEKPAAAEGSEPNRWDAWISRYESGKGRAAWQNGLAEPLEKMLGSKSAAERLAAALPLVALGQRERSLAVMRQLASEQPDRVGDLSEALVWLPWDERLALFNEWRRLKTSENAYYRLLDGFATIPDERLPTILWALASEDKPAGISVINDALERMYRGPNRYPGTQLPTAATKRITSEVSRHIDPKRRIATVLALMLVREIDQQTGLSLAEGMVSDKSAATALRADALRIALRCTNGKEADKLAVARLIDEQAELRRVSLQFLSLGDSAFGPVPVLDGKLYLSVSNWSNEHSPIVVEPPQGLTAEMLKPLVENADEDTSALAQYQMILLGEHKYLKPVLEFWRRQHRQDDQWMRLAYRAIAVTNDSAELPALREIYGKLQNYEINEFYWTIRTMEGPELLKFRKEIRQEHSEVVR